MEKKSLLDTAGPPQPHEVPDIASLNNFLRGVIPNFTDVVEITQFPSGYSNLTFCLKTVQQEYILRRPPVGAAIKSAHDMGREFNVLTALRPHYDKLPAPILYCESAEVIGAPFYLMERLNGVILRASNARKWVYPLRFSEIYQRHWLTTL